MTAAFDAEHERTYGHASPGEPTDLVSLKVLARSSAYADAAVLSRIVEQRARAGRSRARRISGRRPDSAIPLCWGARRWAARGEPAR